MSDEMRRPLRSPELKDSVNSLERYGGGIRIRDSRGIIIELSASKG